MSQALLTMLPPEVRSALEGGAAPEDLMQSMLMARLRAAEEVLDADDVIDAEEPWPELGWPLGYQEPPHSGPPGSELPLEPPSAMTTRLVDLARALGACTLCLGDSSDCPACGGFGAPGWSVPDPELFGELVVPAVRRLQGEALRHAQNATKQFSGLQPDNSNRNGHSHND